MMNRRLFLAQAGAAGLGLAFGPTWLQAQESKQRRPNILFIFTDDQGWGDMGAYGHRVLQTPNMDRLAEQGCRFTNFYVSAPVCAPSRAGMMTGRIQNRFGMMSILNHNSFCPTTLDYLTHVPIFHHVPTDEPMLSRQLQKAGYRTGHIGKWHLSLLGRHETEPTPSDYGFDYWMTLEGGGKGHYRNPTGWMRNGKKVDGKLADWTAELYTDEAIRFIESSGDEPFYLNLWTFTPHEKVDCPDSYKQRYADRTAQEQVYMGCITHLDHELGRLFRYLDEKNLRDNTIIFFSSDNGPESAVVPWGPNARGRTPFRGNKHVLYEGGIRVPGILCWPGVTRPNSTCHVPASTLDLFPTFCAAAAAELPDAPEYALDGGNLCDGLNGDTIGRPHPLYWQYEHALTQAHIDAPFSPALALREGEWKIMSNRGFDKFELYNLDIDPAEHWNLAKQHPDITQRMVGKLRQMFEQVNGPHAQRAKFINPHIKDPTRLQHVDVQPAH